MVQRTKLVINTEERENEIEPQQPSAIYSLPLLIPLSKTKATQLSFFPFQLGNCGSNHAWIKDLILRYNSFQVDNTAKIQPDAKVQLN